MNSNTTLRRIVVTGSNKGIGYEIVGKLLASTTPYQVVLTARNPSLGEKAVESLRVKYPQSAGKVIFQQLDVNDEKSISSFADWIKATFGKIDVLVNNAGVGLPNSTEEDKKFIIKTNFLSLIKLTDKLLPLLSEDGKILMISSALGGLDIQGETLRKALEDPSLDLTKLLQVANNFLELSKDFNPPFPHITDAAYPGSKALLNTYVKRFLPQQLGANQQLYAICPGWCKTDLGSDYAPLTAADGADTPVYLIDLPFKKDSEINGKFITERKVRGW